MAMIICIFPAHTVALEIVGLHGYRLGMPQLRVVLVIRRGGTESG